MAAAKRDEAHGLRIELTEALRDALRGKTSPELLEAATAAAAESVRRRFAVQRRRDRPRKTTERALSMVLPAVGVTIEVAHKGKTYVVSVVEGNMVRLVLEGEVVGQFNSLKSAALSILGYAPSSGGWRFFFGHASHAEVAARYGRR